MGDESEGEGWGMSVKGEGWLARVQTSIVVRSGLLWI